MPTLNWLGKKAVINHDRDVPFHLLQEVPELSFGDKDAGNILIQGDNLIALKSLLPYYAGRVKCIYIDPPYNTGNEGWVYNDNVNDPEIKAWINQVVGKEAEDLSRHDKWLCMMYPRLKLLREFLKNDGLLFVNIDDIEQAHLRVVLDELFGCQNFLANIAWEKRYTRSNNAKLFYSLKDAILVYRKTASVNLLKEKRTEKANSNYSNPDNDSRGPWMTSSYVNPATKEKRPNLVYPITRPDGTIINHPTHAWKYSKEEHQRHVRENLLWWGQDGKAQYPRLKLFSSAASGMVPVDIWDYKTTGTTDEGGNEIKALFGSLSFDTPKPERLLQRVLQLCTDKGDIVMDSYLGSGTTCAVAHKMGRRYIGIEMGEHCETHCAVRLKKVVEGEQGGISKEQDWKGGGGFRYYRLGIPLFDEYGNVFGDVSFSDLAKHVFFSETGLPLPDGTDLSTPFIGAYEGRAIYLLYNGILRDRNPRNGNVLTREVLTYLPAFDGPKVVYGTGCRLSAMTLRAAQIEFKQIPYELKR